MREARSKRQVAPGDSAPVARGQERRLRPRVPHAILSVYTANSEGTAWPHFATPPRKRRCSVEKEEMRTPIRLARWDRSTSRPFHRQWAVAGFDALRIVDATTKGVTPPSTTRSPTKRRSPADCGTHSGCTPRPSGGRLLPDDRRALQRRGWSPLRRRERAEKRHPQKHADAREKPGRSQSERSGPGTGPADALAYRPIIEAAIPAGRARLERQTRRRRARPVAVASNLPGASPA